MKEKHKPALANKTSYALVGYAFYDLRPGNGVSSIVTTHTVPEVIPTYQQNSYRCGKKQPERQSQNVVCIIIKFNGEDGKSQPKANITTNSL